MKQYYVLHSIDKNGLTTYEPAFDIRYAKRYARERRKRGDKMTVIGVRYKKDIHPNDHWHNVIELNVIRRVQVGF